MFINRKPPAVEQGSDMTPAKIIQRIKEKRIEKGLSLDALAGKTGFSKGYLSKIENGTSLPPISTLHRICEALAVDLTYLFSEEGYGDADRGISIVRRKERREMIVEEGGVRFKNWPLAPQKEGRNMDPYLVEIPLDNPHIYQHEGEELYFLLEGKVKLSYSGKDYILGQGDCVYFDTNVPHTGCSLGRKKAKAFVIFYSYKKTMRKPFTSGLIPMGTKHSKES
jgi:transcriptional regulator with XRE-family HTH domain